MRRRHALILAAALALPACGRAATPSATPGTDATVAPKAVTAAQAATWPAKWCNVQPGMMPAQIVAIMGEPTERLPESMKWLAFEYRFSAFMNADGTARQLDADTSLAPQLGCAVTRQLYAQAKTGDPAPCGPAGVGPCTYRDAGNGRFAIVDGQGRVIGSAGS